MTKLFKLSPKVLTWAIVIISLLTVLGSLFISEVMLIEACKLCWGVRMGLFPILPIAIYSLATKKYDNYLLYIIFSALAFVISAYYCLSTQFAVENLRCGVDGGVDCSTSAVQLFGFVNLPFLGLLVSLAILVISFLLEKRLKNNYKES